ncbi:MAG: gas vesicle protein GvpG [Planctomycetota bacterium]
MFIVDDILFSPAKGFMWIMRELHKAASQELESEADRITAELSSLYMRLETGEITEDEFDERETELLDRLDELQAEE